MQSLAHHIMDLAENCTAGGAALVEISIEEDIPHDRLLIEIKDDGRGLSPETVADLQTTTARGDGVGLGLTLFARACEEADGNLQICNDPGNGVTLRGCMCHSHANRKALGDLGETLITLIMGAPGVNWVMHHAKIREDGSRDDLELDTRAIRADAGAVTIDHPEVIRRIRVMVRQQEVRLRD